MSIEIEILNRIIGAMKPEYISQYNIRMVKNKGTSHHSIVVDAPETPYRNAINSLLFARLKANGKKPYISFNSCYRKLFSDQEVNYYEVESDKNKKSGKSFIRIELNDFVAFSENLLVFSSIMQKIFENLFCLEPFSCCSKYLECSNQKKCVHEDLIFALGCYYQKNLSVGKIFFGENSIIEAE